MSEQLPPSPRVFAVASGKGGVGKTTTAVNVGAALAASGAETVVVDADLGMANVADLLDFSIPGPTLQDVLADELAVEKATYRSHEGLAVVPGATDLDSYAGVDPGRLGEVVDALRAEFEYVLLDAGAGLSHDSALPLGLADAVVLVTTPRETAARDAAKTREVAGRIDATVGGVVVTRVREEPSELDPDAVAERVGAPVLAAVPEDGAVREALAAGRPIVAHAPASLVTAAYRRLAAALVGREAVEPVAEAGEPADGGDPTSMDELLEREADRSTDVSALTGDSTSGDGDSIAEDDDSAGDPPPLDFEDEAGSPDPFAADPEDIGAESDGDILIAEETPPGDADEEPAADPESATDPDAGKQSSEGDDPLADIPRFDDESAEEFTRGNEVGDPLAADPADGIALASEDGRIDEAEPDADVGDEPAEGDPAEAADASATDATDGDEAVAGPRVEMEGRDDDADGGLLGRLAGLFR